MAEMNPSPAPSRVIRRITIGLALLAVAFLGVPLAISWLRPDRPDSRVDEQRLRILETIPLNTAGTGTAADPQDWPQWRGPNRDGISPESGLAIEWGPSGPPLLWRARIGSGFSAVTIAQGRAYTLFQAKENEVVICWDAEMGKELWRHQWQTPVIDAQEKRSGPRSTPAVADGKIYAIGSSGRFFCLDAATGEVKWQHDLLVEYGATLPVWGVSCSPLVDGNRVFTCPGGPGGRSIVAFDTDNGKEVWKSQDDTAGYSSPILVNAAGRRQLLMFTGKALVSLSPVDGALYWRYSWPTDYDVNAATPICAGNYVFISSNYGKGCALVEIVPEADGSLQARMVYENNRMKNHFSSCVLFNDHLYGFDDTFLVCLSFRTGKVCWKERGFGKGSLLLADGRLMVLGEDGKLAVSPATPEGFQPQSTFRFSENRCWTMPVVAGGKLYLRDESEIACFSLKKP